MNTEDAIETLLMRDLSISSGTYMIYWASLDSGNFIVCSDDDSGIKFYEEFSDVNEAIACFIRKAKIT